MATQLTPKQKQIISYLQANPSASIEHMRIYASVIDGDYITVRDDQRNEVMKIRDRTFTKIREFLKQAGQTERSIGITIRNYKLA